MIQAILFFFWLVAILLFLKGQKEPNPKYVAGHLGYSVGGGGYCTLSYANFFLLQVVIALFCIIQSILSILSGTLGYKWVCMFIIIAICTVWWLVVEFKYYRWIKNIEIRYIDPEEEERRYV